jgi:hypothetical protein
MINLLTKPFKVYRIVTPFSLRSHHRTNLDESKFDWDACGMFLLSIKKKFSPFDEPCTSRYLYIMIIGWKKNAFVCGLPETFSNLFDKISPFRQYTF